MGESFPLTDILSDRVSRVLGLNAGLMTGLGTNTYLVGKGGAVLIDTGAGHPEYPPLLQNHLRRVRASGIDRVLLTHRHRDHMRGAVDLRRLYPRITVSKLIHKDPELPLPMEGLKDGDVIQADGATFTALHTPGHASDHLCYYLREERALFTGDLILGGTTSVIPPDDGDMGLYMASLRRLLEQDVERIYPGHGPVIEDARGKISEYIDHRLMREQQVLDALRAGEATVSRMVARIYVDVPKVLHPAAQWSVQSHLIKLEREGMVEHVLEDGARHWLLR